MSEFHDKIYEIAKMDHKAANILSRNGMFPQSIYFYEQCFEKSLKAVIAKYNSHVHNFTDDQIRDDLKTKGHNVMLKTIDVMKALIEKEIELYVKRGGKESDPFIKNTIQLIDNYTEQEFPIDEHVTRFFYVVESTYGEFYKRLYVPRNDTKEHYWKYLRTMFDNPDKKYLKFMTLSWVISPVLKNMDMLTRYPDPSSVLNKNNVSLLMDLNNSQACNRLEEMLEDHMNLVPVVWKAVNKL